MKPFKILAIILSFTCILACKNEKKDTDTTSETPTENVEQYVVKPEGTSVKWTAYKTTEKKAVGGEFATLKFNNKSGVTPQEALNNLEFSIPVSSLMTKDVGRDAKIKASFFGAMLDTDLITGKIKYFNNKCSAELTMNGVTTDLPLDVTITDERRVKMTGVINLKDWNALDALASLNKVCFDLHKGSDGVSKTWEDVAVEISTYLRKK